MNRLIALAIIALTACEGPAGPAGPPGEQSQPPAVEAPADIRIVSAAYASGGLAVAFENVGGAGAFRMQAWGLPSIPAICPCPSDPYTRFLGETEAVEVAGGWKESATYSFSGRAGKLVILSRNKGSINWRETHQALVP